MITDLITAIEPVDEAARGLAAARQLQLTKPPGALGRLEEIGNQLSAISGHVPPPLPTPALVAVFAGDHGVHAAGVTPWPQEVTRQMAANIALGGAGINAIARTVGAEVRVIDVGMLSPVDVPGVEGAAVVRGSADFSRGPALTRDQAEQLIEVGVRVARDAVDQGFRSLATGEVGLANTTVAAALVSVFTGRPAAEVTGRGAGSDDAMLAHKTEVIDAAIAAHRPDPSDPVGVLAAVGGPEHAATVGLILGAAGARIPVLVDGVIGCSAALVAHALCPHVRGYLIAGHDGAEPGVRAALDHLSLAPVLSLGMRLGEGTGAAMAIPLVTASAAILRDMTTFDEAAVSERTDEQSQQ